MMPACRIEQPSNEELARHVETHSPSLLFSSLLAGAQHQQRITTMEQKTPSIASGDNVSLDTDNEQLLIYRRQQCDWQIVSLRSQLNRVPASLSKVQRLDVATACRGESAAADETWISRQQPQNKRTEVRVECECWGLREFLSTYRDHSNEWEKEQWNEMSPFCNSTKAGTR